MPKGIKGFQKNNQCAKGNKPNKTSFKGGQFLNEKHPLWKGNKVSYLALHSWVERKKGKPNHCEICKIKKDRYSWANIDHKYRRNLEDYISLCYSCHTKYDIKNNNKNIDNFKKSKRGNAKNINRLADK